MDVIIVIPAYEPEEALLTLVKELRLLTQAPLLIVDDGSTKHQAQQILHQVNTYPHVTCLTHEHNQGQGAAYKTAFAHILTHEANTYTTLITADADGQHSPRDIMKLITQSQQDPQRVWLGCRQFTGEVPLKSLIGNRFFSRLIQWCYGHSISDTQTGLKAIPLTVVPLLTQLRSNRFDFISELLFTLFENNIPFGEVTIATIYINDNESSHFRPLIDSLQILKVLFSHLFKKLTRSIKGK